VAAWGLSAAQLSSPSFTHWGKSCFSVESRSSL
jgi:hypothetical protein